MKNKVWVFPVNKVKLSMHLINCGLCHVDIWGSGGIAPPFLTSALDEVGWSGPYSQARSYREERNLAPAMN
jgi:hypothetical protein